MSNPAYKAVLDSSPSSNYSWDMMKEILFCNVNFKNHITDLRVILCRENASCAVKDLLNLRDAGAEFFIEYKSPLFTCDSHELHARLVGHIHLNKALLNNSNINMHDIINKCQDEVSSIRKKENFALLFKRIHLSVSECCSFGEGSKWSWIDMGVICPALLDTVVKGDPRIAMVNIIWINPHTSTSIGISSGSQIGELVVELVVERKAVKKSGDAWRIVLDCCLPVFHLIDSISRSIPYSVQQIQQVPGISCAFDQAVKEILFCNVNFKNDITDLQVILCRENASCAVKDLLNLRDAGAEFFIEYKSPLVTCDSHELDARLVGHIHLNMALLNNSNINMHDIINKCQDEVNSFRKKENFALLFKRMHLSVSECCSFGEGSKWSWIDMGESSDIMADIICPALLDTVVKGDPRIAVANIIWINPDTSTSIGISSGSQIGELAVELVVERKAVKKSGDAWRIVLDCCLPVFHLIDSISRSIPYSVQQIQQVPGISCAFDQAVKRLSTSVKIVTKGTLLGSSTPVLQSPPSHSIPSSPISKFPNFRLRPLKEMRKILKVILVVMALLFSCGSDAQNFYVGDTLAATYCVCMDGLPNKVMQTNIDYACGGGADCTPILPDGACFQPDTLKAHCDFAVNNYFHEMGQVPVSCDFGGSAFMTSTLPRTTIVLPGCIYPTSASPRPEAPEAPPSPKYEIPYGPPTHHEGKDKTWSRIFKYAHIALCVIGIISTLLVFYRALGSLGSFLSSCSDWFDVMNV